MLTEAKDPIVVALFDIDKTVTPVIRLSILRNF